MQTAMRERYRQQPDFFEAVLADARTYAAFRGRPIGDGTTIAVFEALWLTLVSDSFLAQVMYRAKARTRALRIPIVPFVFHRLAMMIGQISIGDPVLMEAGIYIAHGQVVIDGITEVRSGTFITPFVTIGLKAGDLTGPTIGRNVRIGTGSKILGPVVIGDRASIGANAVVVDDVDAGVTVVGAPARPLGQTA